MDITPEGQAFSDFIEGKAMEANPYTPDTIEHTRYNVAMREMLITEAEG